MAPNNEGRAALVARPTTDELTQLAAQIGLDVCDRDDIRVWEQSGVERVRMSDGTTRILKYCIGEFDETDVLAHAANHGVAVPHLVTSMTRADSSVLMLIEDLGVELREPTLVDAATAAVTIHACPGVSGRPVLDSAGLAALPGKALRWLAQLREEGRWLSEDADEIRALLEQLAKVAYHRAHGAETSPFGLCHSEFHPTSLHIGTRGLTVLDWARAYTGSGLLDLVSWQGTSEPLDLAQVEELIDAYISAGGPKEAQEQRGGLPAHVWAAGWDKAWICEWFLEGTARWATPDMDHSLQKTIGRHLKEAVECLAQ